MALHVAVAPWGIILLFLLALMSFTSRVPVLPSVGDTEAATLTLLDPEQKRTLLDSVSWTSTAQYVNFPRKSSYYLDRQWRRNAANNPEPDYRSALGDPGMRSDKVRVAAEGWNFCNRVGDQADITLSPRWADCADISSTSSSSGALAEDFSALWEVVHKVSESDNNLKTGDSFPERAGEEFHSVDDPDLYAIEKEKYLASLCQVKEPKPWHFWMIMLKSGNFDLESNLCPVEGTSSSSSVLDAEARAFVTYIPMRQLVVKKDGFPCFGPGCMNQPVLYHNRSQLELKGGEGTEDKKEGSATLTGSFHGTYDLSADDFNSGDNSYFSVQWHKNTTNSSWFFHHVLRVSEKYPWLMLYLRADATKGESGGYPWDTRGMMHTVPESPNFKVVLTLNVIRGGGSQSQFYLLDIGGCWKNNGKQCNGELDSDVTRYTEMIINPDIQAWCNPHSLDLCPPYHTSIDGEKIYRNDTENFPYDAYHLYCSPYNAEFAEKPFRECDRYSNPLAQELLQLLPHPEWALHGYPAKKGDGWIGNPRKWELDAGGLSSRLYFYQDPGTPPATRRWPSIDVGTEIYVSTSTETAEWTLSDFDVLIPK